MGTKTWLCWPYPDRSRDYTLLYTTLEDICATLPAGSPCRPRKRRESAAKSTSKHGVGTATAQRKHKVCTAKARGNTAQGPRKHSSAKSTAKAPRARREKARAYTTKGRRKRFQMTFTRAVRAPPRLRRSTGPRVVCFVFLCCVLHKLLVVSVVFVFSFFFSQMSAGFCSKSQSCQGGWPAAVFRVYFGEILSGITTIHGAGEIVSIPSPSLSFRALPTPPCTVDQEGYCGRAGR